MICLFRAILFFIIGTSISIIGIVFCLFNPRNPKNVARFAHLFCFFLTPIFGIKVHTREYKDIKKLGKCIFIANHQDNFDMIVAAQIVQSKTVTVGKKSLVWIPFFGLLYYLSGNILIDRNNKSKARNTIEQVIYAIKNRDISIWMFPEGTRSKGRGLLPFKSGAFKAAIAAGVPIVPICVSNTNQIKLNRWHNGNMIVEMLEPIDTMGMSKENVRELMNHCHEIMAEKIKQLNDEAKTLNAKDKQSRS